MCRFCTLLGGCSAGHSLWKLSSSRGSWEGSPGGRSAEHGPAILLWIHLISSNLEFLFSSRWLAHHHCKTKGLILYVFSLNSLFLSQLFVECMKSSPFLYFASTRKPLTNFHILSFLMFIPGRLVGIEENCEILPGCLPAVSIKCQHSSQRTGKENGLSGS